MNLFDQIQSPTLLLDETKARRNIQRMAQKARAQDIRFRPHFKTHQSAQIGEWFRAEGVKHITVSSLEMAEYFAACGWEDITLALPVNLRQAEGIRSLARRIRLGILVEAPEIATRLAEEIKDPLEVWIKVDSGLGRTGISWQDTARLHAVAQAVRAAPQFHLQGLLTHAGHTYAARNAENVRQIYAESLARMIEARAHLAESGIFGLECSVGDTPGCSLSADLGPVDEIRPGNFVLYDAQMLTLGVCQAEDVAAVLVCPILSCHPERSEVVVYGGAIHLSKDDLHLNGQRIFGLVGLPSMGGWGAPIPGAFVRGLSQEHGILRLPPESLPHFRVGELACIYPAHSCLSVNLMRKYLTLSGQVITTL